MPVPLQAGEVVALRGEGGPTSDPPLRVISLAMPAAPVAPAGVPAVGCRTRRVARAAHSLIVVDGGGARRYDVSDPPRPPKAGPPCGSGRWRRWAGSANIRGGRRAPVPA